MKSNCIHLKWKHFNITSVKSNCNISRLICNDFVLPPLQQLHPCSNQLCIAITVIFGYNICTWNYIRLQYFGFTFSHIKLHLTTIFQLHLQIFWLHLQPHQQLSTTSRLQEHIMTKYISFKLHLTTIFQLHLQPHQQLLTTSQLQEQYD